MSLDLASIDIGITKAFTDNVAAVAALIGGLHKTEATKSPSGPYVVFQFITGLPDPTFTSDGEILNYQFSFFNKTASPQNFTIMNDVVKKVTAVYDDATLTITDHTSIAVTRLTFGFLPTIDQTQGFFVNYEIMVEDD